ncbi:deoxyribose-phosphate aldolase (plasmid) [Streptomyces sp. BB1-1-1]|uniref:deoxyribose-phosphate aldolase n=1 Tax=Streptomyces sp. BB1-1-1 TaxID=3074430 RepID=UPI002877F2B8|nr:deoxyribose-phosphate aldolase [Streptomyces sp. BB1-1-1]WND32856.1 deoxyribose-phosphate aldolase [Streptomyces sp. BB1-1-1]WND40076.1 deoxyribose-phosphate aldolase [Streptomyces sp. BB1-1-1]WND40910.1 deoxyribose-phosphate aldolase [Streptomyces sp. BB1-1-1]
MTDDLTLAALTRTSGLGVAEVAKMIDHSLLRPELTWPEVRTGCALAARYAVASVCVKPTDVGPAAREMAGTGTAVGTVIGFPHGASVTSVKTAEVHAALADGAVEFDMVINIARLRAGDEAAVSADIAAVVEAAQGGLVKVILENAYLTDREKIRGCVVAESAGAHFVKTSTGFAPTGATLSDVRLMRSQAPPHMGVKAAGGVRSLDALLDMFEAGASRFGATATAAILDELAMRHTGQPEASQPTE